MFKCSVTGRMTRPGAKMNRVPVQTREKTYTEMIHEDGEWVEIEVGKGFETVKELQVSDEGLQMLSDMDLDEKNALLHRLGVPGQYGMQQ